VSYCRVILDNEDVTKFVVTEDWPEWIESSVKGPGFFEWRLKSFEFRLHESCPTAPVSGLPVRVLVGDTERFTGYIDEGQDAFSKVPLLVCQPLAVLLKEVRAGRVGVDQRTQSECWKLELDGATVQEACEAVVENFDENRDSRMPAVGWSAVVLGDTSDPAGIMAPHGLTGPEAGTNYYEPQVQQGWGGEPLSSLVPLTMWSQVRIVNGLPTLGVLYMMWRIGGAYGEWPGTMYYGFRVARFPASGPVDAPVPVAYAPGASYENFNGYSLLEWEAFPLAESSSSLVSDSTAIAYAQQASGLGEGGGAGMRVLAAYDTADGAWLFVAYGLRVYATWWGNPLVQRITGRWQNESMMDLLKLFAQVSGRWLKADGSVLTLLPRASDSGEVQMPAAGQAIDRDRQRRWQTPGRLNIESLNPDDPGSWGIEFGPGRLAALQYWYVDGFSGESVETTATYPMVVKPAGVQLLAGAVEDGEPGQKGLVVELDWSTDGRLWRYRSIREGT